MFLQRACVLLYLWSTQVFVSRHDSSSHDSQSTGISAGTAEAAVPDGSDVALRCDLNELSGDYRQLLLEKMNRNPPGSSCSVTTPSLLLSMARILAGSVANSLVSSRPSPEESTILNND